MKGKRVTGMLLVSALAVSQYLQTALQGPYD